MKKICCCFILLVSVIPAVAQSGNNDTAPIIPGAERTGLYLPYLRNKNVAVFANQTSLIGGKNIVDTLIRLGIHVKVVFGPEHGFRGEADAGATVASYTDPETGIKVVSLYGNKTRPSPQDLKGIDIMVYDIQDVGVRFYTFISSLQEYLESALENKIPLLILDRPDPNGSYIDGPVLDTAYRSFVGMQPIPVVYGLTPGEYALMIAGEQWLTRAANIAYRQQTSANSFSLKVIPCANYTHHRPYRLPVKPSPNLPYMSSVYWYPSICFFEGTVMSEGRGTAYPFEIFGHPALPSYLYRFEPHADAGAQDPKYRDKICYGWNITSEPLPRHLELRWLLKAYQRYPDKTHFFLSPSTSDHGDPRTYFFNKLAGNDQLMKQIEAGLPEAAIRKSWQPALQQYKKIRKKYLLYPE